MIAGSLIYHLCFIIGFSCTVQNKLKSLAGSIAVMVHHLNSSPPIKIKKVRVCGKSTESK